MQKILCFVAVTAAGLATPAAATECDAISWNAILYNAESVPLGGQALKLEGVWIPKGVVGKEYEICSRTYIVFQQDQKPVSGIYTSGSRKLLNVQPGWQQIKQLEGELKKFTLRLAGGSRIDCERRSETSYKCEWERYHEKGRDRGEMVAAVVGESLK